MPSPMTEGSKKPCQIELSCLFFDVTVELAQRVRIAHDKLIEHMLKGRILVLIKASVFLLQIPNI